MFVNYSMYKKILIILIIYFNGLIANEAKIDSTEFNFEDEYHYDWNKLDEFFEKSIKSKINKLLNPDSFQLIVKLNSNKVDTFKFTIESEDGGDFLPASIISNLTSEQIKVKVYIEESVYNDEIHESVVQIIKATEPALIECDDCIEIESIKKIMNQKSTISLNRDDIYDDSWAVIIGIDKYKYSDQLNYAVNDAEAVKDMLISKFDYPEENIRYLVDDEATLSKIKLALDDISTSADENDRVLVFYSGHGETQKNNDGTETGYIIPVEGRQEKPYATGLAMDDILRTCQMSNAKHMLFLMDACYSGLMTENVKGLSKPQEKGYLSKVANEKARQIITAGGGGEQVIERDEWQHSAFTKNLLAGLDNWESDTDEDGYVTADELGTYLRKSVTEDSDFQQTPQKGRFRNSGGGEFVFFSNHNAINQNVEDESVDAKLDYLISEMEELKSQKSNSDDIIVEKDVDEKQSRHIKIQKTQGIGFMAFEDLLQIGYTRALNGNWYYLMSYANIQGKLFKKLINVESSHTITGNNHSIGLVRYYVLTDYQNNDFMWLLIGGVANYLTVSWKDTERNISGDVNKIFPSLTAGIGLRPFWINKYSIGAGVTLSIATSLLPKSYSETDGIITLSGWQIKLFPALLLNIDFPLPK